MINHRSGLEKLNSELLEIIEQHCRLSLETAKGTSITYHKDRGAMARNILNERILTSQNENTKKHLTNNI